MALMRRATCWSAIAVALLGAYPQETTHAVPLDEAERLVAGRAAGLAVAAAASFNEIRSGESRTAASATCRRVSEHSARCVWRASVASDFGGLATGLEDAALVCAGRAAATLEGSQLRVRISSASCQH